MSLDRSKLQMVRELGNGGWQAQCPACGEAGQDRKGEHLRISQEGKFGCCVFPGDRQHRRRIFALVGDHGPKAIKVRVASAKTASPAQLDLLGRLGRLFESPAVVGGKSTGNVGTLGTGISDPRAYANESVNDDLFVHKLIGSQEPVPSVPEKEFENGVPSVPEDEGNRTDETNATNGTNGEPATARLPHLLSDGTLVIPFNSPERYHWWKGGQSIRQTLTELQERKELDACPF